MIRSKKVLESQKQKIKEKFAAFEACRESFGKDTELPAY
jgi:hypothetical protein